MKSFLLIYLISGWVAARAQAVGVFGGRSLMSADYIAIQYFHPSNYPLQFTAKLFGESSGRNRLRYVSYGAAALLDYSSAQESFHTASLSYRISLGAVILIEKEPWIWNSQKPHPQTGFGCIGEVTGVWTISTAFSLCAFGQQRWLFRPVLGNNQFVFGMGLICQLNTNY